MDDLFTRELDDWLPHIQDDLENGEFEMSYQELFSKMHAFERRERVRVLISGECKIQEEQIVIDRHLPPSYECDNPECICHGGRADEREAFAHEPDEEEYEEAWDALQDVPSYVEQQSAAFAQEV